MKSIGKFRRLLAEEGVGATVVRVANVLTPDWVFCAHCGYLTQNDLAVLPGYRGSETVRWATAKDLREILKLEPYCDDLPGWIERGDLFVVALRDGEIVGFENYQKNLHRFVPVPWICVDLADDELWAVYSLVHPKCRGQGIVGDLVNFASKKLLEDGFRYVHGHTAKGDASASRAHTKRGFKSIDNWRIYRVLGRTFFRSRLTRFSGRWSEAQPLKVSIKEASGSASPPAQGKRRKKPLALVPNA